VASQAGTIHLWKVKSHIGIVGNEQADLAAGQVAKGEIPYTQVHQFPHPSNQRGSLAWPYNEHVTDSGEVRMTPLANMRETLAEIALHAGELGQSNQDSIYFRTWLQMCPEMQHEFSHKFITSASLAQQTKKLVHQARWGHLPTQKLFSRWDKTGNTSSLCLLCGQEDGGHHAISGCKALSQTVTLRHNDAGATIVKAIRKGSMGSQLMTSDVGLRTRSNVEELTRDGKTMTTRRKFTAADFDAPCMHHFPEQVKLALINQQSVPDALMYDEEHDDFTIVEVKYCRDTDRTTQSTKAAKQHQQLCESIAEPLQQESSQPAEQDTGMADLHTAITSSGSPQTRVRQVTILLGVTGVIYKDTLDYLKNLGVEGSALRTLLTDLHYIAIHGLERIWRQRGALIRQLGYLKWVNFSKNKKSRYKRGLQAPSHRKHNKKRKYCL
jgi:hypothetical protein